MKDSEMKPVIFGVHGYNTNGKSIRVLAEYFHHAGYSYCPFIYGKVFIGAIGNLIANRFRTDDVAKRLIDTINVLQQPVVVLGHSNGAMLAWLAARECENVIGVICLDAALDEERFFECWEINCYHPDDWVLKYFAKWRLFSLWGSRGAYENHSAEVNINLKDYFDSFNPHSGILKKQNAKVVVPEICKKIDRLISQNGG